MVPLGTDPGAPHIPYDMDSLKHTILQYLNCSNPKLQLTISKNVDFMAQGWFWHPQGMPLGGPRSPYGIESLQHTICKSFYCQHTKLWLPVSKNKDFATQGWFKYPQGMPLGGPGTPKVWNRSDIPFVSLSTANLQNISFLSLKIWNLRPRGGFSTPRDAPGGPQRP